MSIFKCKWVNGNIGVHQDQLGFTLVDLQKVAYKNKPFIMAEQARQVFYVQDSCDSRLLVVLQEQVVSVTKMMIQPLIFVRCLVSPHKCLS